MFADPSHLMHLRCSSLTVAQPPTSTERAPINPLACKIIYVIIVEVPAANHGKNVIGTVATEHMMQQTPKEHSLKSI